MNALHICEGKYYISSNFQSIVATFSCNTFIYVLATLSPTISGGAEHRRGCKDKEM